MKPRLVFIGPSLPFRRAAYPPHIVLRPPARCGDLIRALGDDPAAVALVDGVFESAPTVWHKEILAVIDAGVPVYGAASLGALRAAELHPFGMIGVGTIFAAYRDGAIDSDAAVMVSHAPEELGHRPVTLALVDAEASLHAAPLVPDERAMLLGIARRMNFRARSWDGIFKKFGEGAGVAAADRASRIVAAVAFSQKERDVGMLIDRLVTDRPSVTASCPLPRTVFLDRLIKNCACRSPAGGAPA